MERMEVELPVPLPTWNRMLAMHHWERKKLRDLLHKFVSLSLAHGTDWPTVTDYQGKPCSTDLLIAEYFLMIRPNKSRKLDIAKKRAEWKKQLSSLKKQAANND